RLRVEGFTEALLGERPFDALALDGRVELHPTDLTAIAALDPMLPLQSGTLAATVELRGTLQEPRPEGRLTLAGGTLKAAGAVPTISDIATEVRVSPEVVALEQLSARLGLGSIRGSGTWRAAEGTTLLDAATEGELDLEFAAVDALVLRSTGTKLRADADLEVAGRFSDRVDVTGDVAITSGTFVRRMSMVPDIARRGGVGVDSGIRLFEIPPPIGDALRFDV